VSTPLRLGFHQSETTTRCDVSLLSVRCQFRLICSAIGMQWVGIYYVVGLVVGVSSLTHPNLRCKVVFTVCLCSLSLSRTCLLVSSSRPTACVTRSSKCVLCQNAVFVRGFIVYMQGAAKKLDPAQEEWLDVYKAIVDHPPKRLDSCRAFRISCADICLCHSVTGRCF
jgi:hypothetical protein